MTLNKLTKKQALEVAKAASQITVTDSDFGWRYEPVSFEKMMEIITEYAGKNWKATQYEGSNMVSIDTLGRTHIEVTL